MLQNGGDVDTASVQSSSRSEIPTASTVPETYFAGTGSPLVLLHGAASSWRAWGPVLPGLSAHHRVLAPNLVGHGGRTLECVPSEVLTRTVDGLIDWLDEADIHTPHVAGNSLGGWVALELARRGRAASVTALSPAGSWGTSRDLDRLLGLFRVSGHLATSRTVRRMLALPAVRRALLGTAYAHPERLPLEDAVAVLEDAAQCRALDLFLRGATEIGPMEPLGEVPCPVRIAWGVKDRTLPFHRYGRHVMTAVPGAELVALPGVGHVPMADDPDLVIETILAVTRRVDATEA